MAFLLGLAQCKHPQDGDVVGMVDAWMRRAKDAGVSLLVFPESLMTPYELGADAFARAAEPIDGPFATAMGELAARYGIWCVFTMNERRGVRAGGGDADVVGERAGGSGGGDGGDGGGPGDGGAAPDDETPDGGVVSGGPGDGGGGAGAGAAPFNTAVVVDDTGERRAVYRKVHLFDTDFTRESDKVSAGDELLAPVKTPFCTLGVGICYDLRFPEAARAAALAGADVLVYPAAWVDGPRKVEQWRTLLCARAIENELFVAGLSRCDRGFGLAKRNYAGHSCVFGPLGEELAHAGLDEELLVAEIDLGRIASARAAMPVLAHRRPDVYGKVR